MTNKCETHQDELVRQIVSRIGREGLEASSRRLLATAMDEIIALQKEVDHWKANHAREVERARILKERPDMPIERAQAYEQLGRMQTALTNIASLRETIKWMTAEQPGCQERLAVAGFKDAVRIARKALKEQ